jgi:hypothetical protein
MAYVGRDRSCRAVTSNSALGAPPRALSGIGGIGQFLIAVIVLASSVASVAELAAAPLPASDLGEVDAAALGLPTVERPTSRAALQERGRRHPLFRSREEALRREEGFASLALPWTPLPSAWREHYSPAEDPDVNDRRFAFLPEPGAYAAAVAEAVVAPSEEAHRSAGAFVTPDEMSTVWTPIGAGIENGSYDIAGRVTELAYAFDDAQGFTTLWAGTVGGGLWKFQVVFPLGFWVRVSASLPGSPSVGSFVVRGSSSAQILVGTGDFLRYPGTGVYRTLDGGGHWHEVALGASPSTVFRLREDWFNGGTVFAATDAGLFRSSNFGGAWSMPSGLPAGGWVSDLIQDPDGPEYWYAAVYGDGVYLSVDGGQSFLRNTDPASPVCAGSADNIPGTFGRAAFAISPDAANFVYALVENGRGGLTGVFRSADYGCHWAAIDSVDMISWGQEHANAIGVDPVDADRLFVGMGGLQYTENATAPTPCWVRNTGGTCAPTCGDPCVDGGHPDFTDVLFVPRALSPGNTTVLLANDGGYYAYDWTSHAIESTGNRLGLNALQVMQPHQAMAAAHGDPNLLLAGLQDNGVVRIRIDTEPVLSSFSGGDGGQVSLSPDDASEWHASWGADYNRYLSTTAGSPWLGVNCTLGNEWAMSMQKDPTPGLSSEVFTYTNTEAAAVQGVQDLAALTLTAAETLTLTYNLAVLPIALASGWNIMQIRNEIDNALFSAGFPVLTFPGRPEGGFLRIESAQGGADTHLRVVSDRGSGPGTTGFGTVGFEDWGTDGFLWSKPVSGSCDWIQVNPGARLPVAPIFHAKQVDQANNAAIYLLYATGWFDQRLLVFEGGEPGSMTWEERTPPLPTPTSTCREGFGFADRSDAQPRTVYYSTGCTRPSRVFVSFDAGALGSWFAITGNLATLAADASFFELVGDPTDPNRFFLGTDVGLFRTDSGLAGYPIWYRWMEGMPAVANVMDLELAADGLAQPLLRIGTYGQGFWQRTVGLSSFLFADGFESGTFIAWSNVVP